MSDQPAASSGASGASPRAWSVAAAAEPPGRREERAVRLGLPIDTASLHAASLLSRRREPRLRAAAAGLQRQQLTSLTAPAPAQSSRRALDSQLQLAACIHSCTSALARPRRRRRRCHRLTKQSAVTWSHSKTHHLGGARQLISSGARATVAVSPPPPLSPRRGGGGCAVVPARRSCN